MAKQKIKVIREEMLQVANNVAKEKNINQDDVFSAMEQALEKSARVKYGMERDIRVNINRENGDIKLESYLKVVNSYSEEVVNGQEKNLVHKKVIKDLGQLDSFDVYCCGAPGMIEVAYKEFVEAGLNPNSFYSDAFTFAPK